MADWAISTFGIRFASKRQTMATNGRFAPQAAARRQSESNEATGMQNSSVS
jgi:hypothetical protein